MPIIEKEDFSLNKLLNKILKGDLKMNTMVKVVYRGIEHEITVEQYEDLRNGWISWSDMFD